MAAEVHTQGLRLLLECLAGLDSVPSSCWIGLAADESLAENATRIGEGYWKSGRLCCNYC